MRKVLLLLPLLLAPAAQAWPYWAEVHAESFCEYRSIGLSTEKSWGASYRDLLAQYPGFHDQILAAQDDGTWAATTAAAIDEACPDAWQIGE
ncbi:MAG: hypothetical protein VYE46_04170 [Cyanobacteriota bacterium]|nr:hypothetical protein [Cyanobacteriota bacterium]